MIQLNHQHGLFNKLQYLISSSLKGFSQVLLVGMIKGIGEVFGIYSLWTESLILIALFWVSRRFGVYAIIGAFKSWLTAYFIGADSHSLNLGLYNIDKVEWKTNFLLIHHQ